MALISFIIPAHNEELMLPRTLAAIHGVIGSLGESAEIVVANDSSTDRTGEVALEHGARVASASCRQIAGSRNAGAREARGDYFFFVDADTVVTEAAVKAALKAMRAGAAGGGSGFEFDGKPPLYARLMLPVSLLVFRLVGLASGCFLYCTRAAFQATGGFDESLFAAEETFMSLALKKQGKFVVLREKVITSGRKLRTYTGWELLGIVLRVGLRGRRGVKKREGLDIWYGKRREDPGDAQI